MKTILCYGDSNTYGYNPANGLRFDENKRWTSLLKQSLVGTCYIVEEGCNGRTTQLDDPNEEWKNGFTFLKACLNSHKPIDLVLIMLGTNDLKTIFHTTAKETAFGAERLVKETKLFLEQKQGFVPQVLLISPIEIGSDICIGPFSGSFDASAIEESKKFSKLYKEAADRQGCAYFDAASVASPSKTDSLHLDEENHKKLADSLHKEIERILDISQK